jgi:hypothetical protein
MPPQQPDRLLDLFYQPFDFGAHVVLVSRGIPRAIRDEDVAAAAAKRNRRNRDGLSYPLA